MAVQPTEFDGLMPFIYDELKRLAGRHLRRQAPGHTLQATALVHEAYLKLAKVSPTECGDRPRFFALASRAMRCVLVDHARRRLAARRGFKTGRALPDEGGAVVDIQGTEVLEVDRALARLAEIDPRKARIVELRYFGGLTADEAGEVLGISPVTIHRQWLLARTWLRHELGKATAE